MKICAGVIGAGIGLKHLEAINNYKNSKVKIICETNKNKHAYLKKKFPKIKITSKVSEIFKNREINLVSIASYDNFHYSQVLNSIKFKKNIIVEKPMCLKPSELQVIYKKIKQNKNINITSNLVLRVNSLFKNLKNKIKKDKVYYIEGDYIWGRKQKLFGWRSKLTNYSVTLGAGIHIIDLVNWITNLKPISVYAQGSSKVTKKGPFKKNNLVSMFFKYPNEIIVKITANCAAVYNHNHELKIFTDKQTLVKNDLGAFIYRGKNKYKIQGKYPDKINRKKLIRNFIDCLLDGKTKPIISLKEQIDLMTICFAVDKSVKLNKKIKIKYL